MVLDPGAWKLSPRHSRVGASSPLSYCVRSAFLSYLPTDGFGITWTNAQF